MVDEKQNCFVLMSGIG